MIKEPIIREALPGHEALVGDISIRGVWQPQSTAVFDVRVTDSDSTVIHNGVKLTIIALRE